jgi:glycosyltransferase involved in cell wall biosynthesis
VVIPCRPPARNVYDLDPEERLQRPFHPAKLKVVALGTIEPGKNFLAAADVCAALADRLGIGVELHIIGKTGSGSEAEALSGRPDVILHGPLTRPKAREVINASDIYLCTSREEGLCLPLLEMQYGGLPIVAPDAPIFRELLGLSGIFIEPGRVDRAAELIAQALARPDWRPKHAAASTSNIERWGRMEKRDRQRLVGFFESLVSDREAVFAQDPLVQDHRVQELRDGPGSFSTVIARGLNENRQPAPVKRLRR